MQHCGVRKLIPSLPFFFSSFPSVLIYIAYICCRNKQSRRRSVCNAASNSNRVGDSASKSQSAAALGSEDIVRESIGQYGDEGGGEDDVRGYDLVALRIQIPGSLHTVGNVHFANGYATADALPLESTRDKPLNFGKCVVLIASSASRNLPSTNLYLMGTSFFLSFFFSH